MSAKQRAEEFLKTADLYQLGELSTEKPHPLTENLSELANTDLKKAVSCLQNVDFQALKHYEIYLPQLESMSRDIHSTLKSGGKIYLCGCGATGRLSLTLEFIWRSLHPESEQVQAFMAGGDIALVHAIEGFEDYPDYGAKQLLEMGFSENDLLIASTEGGETPWVIGAALKATEISKRKTYFLYCNLKQSLIKKVERSRQVITHKKINDICLFVGPMAITGSTRMQASTVLQLSIGLCLFYSWKQTKSVFNRLFQYINSADWSFISEFIECEAQYYLQNEHLLYSVDTDYAICAFTDTTERAPTFSLTAFSHLSSQLPPSLCYVSVNDTQTELQAWQNLLKRNPRPLNWPQNEKLSEAYLLGFDFSEKAIAKRGDMLKQEVFHIKATANGYSWGLSELSATVELVDFDFFMRHLVLKLQLNILSTLIMGRLGRYKNNLMTYVYPTNGKLIDRASRYVRLLLQHDNVHASYDEVVYALFEQLESLKPGESVVLKTYKKLSR